MKPDNGIIKTRKRLLIALLTIIFLFSALFVRLIFVQIIDGAGLSMLASSQWYRDLPLSAPRGLIRDTKGEVLADNIDVYTVYVRPNAMENREEVARALSTALGLTYDSVYETIGKSASEVTVKRQVDSDTALLIEAQNITGVHVTLSSKRNYPKSSMLSKVIGFTNIDNKGQNGIEGYYDKYLTGVDGVAYSFADIAGRETENTVTSYVPAISGCDLTLTVDASIQAFAENAVFGAQMEWGAKSASAIVMEVDTGAVKAMASYPSYDLNNIPRDDIDLLNYLSKNSLVTDVYEPGSTFKIFTTATAIENGVTGDNHRYYCNGSRTVDGQRIKCWRSIGHGSQNLSEGVCNSCNCVFMDLALSLGTERLYNGLTGFGFGSKTNIDFFGESSGIMMKESSVKNVDLARIGFGQAIAATPLQLITGVSAAVNGGTLYEPYFLEAAHAPTGQKIYERSPKAVRKVISDDTSAEMRELLGNVVSIGSGKKASVDGYSMGGKTGTAQKYENGVIAQGKYVSSFVGFAPLDKPKYAILFIVDEPAGYTYYGSLTAAPYAGRIFSNIFDYENTPPDIAVEAKEYVEIPALEGNEASTAVKMLESLGFVVEVAGESGPVVSITPSPLTKAQKGSVVLVRLETG